MTKEEVMKLKRSRKARLIHYLWKHGVSEHMAKLTYDALDNLPDEVLIKVDEAVYKDLEHDGDLTEDTP